MRSRREPGTRQEPGRRRISRESGAIAAQHEPIGRNERGLEVDRGAADVEVAPEGVGVGEVGRDDEAGRLLVDEGEVGVADARGGQVGHLGRLGGGADAAGGKGDVLLEPGEGGRDRGAQVRGRVDHDDDVAVVEGEGAADGGGCGGDCGWRLVRGLGRERRGD